MEKQTGVAYPGSIKMLRCELTGLLVVDKPLGWTSMAVVRRVRSAAAGCKTGHGGTLDPLATGVLICCLGRATRSVEKLMGLVKVYEAQIDLSAVSDTDDREGPLRPVAVDQAPTRTALQRALSDFVGLIQQTPPTYSAVHVGGRRAYALARSGAPVVPSARTVRIDAVELHDYAWPLLSVRITCGRGTYIRSLARDLGQSLGTGGHLAGLRRLSIGPYDLTRSILVERLDRPIGQRDLLACPGDD